MKLLQHILTAWFGLILLTGCSAPAGVQAGDLTLRDAWVRAPMGMEGMSDSTGGVVTGAFLRIENKGSQPDRLVKVESDAAELVEIHKTEMTGDTMTMQQVDGVDVPAGGSAELKPGGFHIMLINLTRTLKAGDEVTLTLTFEQAGAVTLTAAVRDQ